MACCCLLVLVIMNVFVFFWVFLLFHSMLYSFLDRNMLITIVNSWFVFSVVLVSYIVKLSIAEVQIFFSFWGLVLMQVSCMGFFVRPCGWSMYSADSPMLDAWYFLSVCAFEESVFSFVFPVHFVVDFSDVVQQAYLCEVEQFIWGLQVFSCFQVFDYVLCCFWCAVCVVVFACFDNLIFDYI